jgi:hypothetical protein
MKMVKLAHLNAQGMPNGTVTEMPEEQYRNLLKRYPTENQSRLRLIPEEEKKVKKIVEPK